MSERILLIDDDPVFRSVVSAVLKEKGFSLICAASGSEARLEHASAEFDLLIVDGSLPDTDGLSLIEEFRKSRPKEAILFVSASWRDSESYHRLSKVLSVNSILHKPILPMVLLQEVDKALGRGVPIAASKTGKLAEKLARMSAEFASELPAQILEIQKLAEKSRLQNNAVCIAETERKVHMLRGTAASFGFPRVSELMGLMEDGLQIFKDNPAESESRLVWQQCQQFVQECLDICRSLPQVRLSDSQVARLPYVTCELIALLVSQDKEIIKIARDFAAKNKIELQTCTLESARETIFSRHFDILFLEADKDLGSAFTLARELRANSKFSGVPFALIKQNKEHAVLFEEIYAGFDLVLSRPVEVNDFHTAFHNLIVMRKESLARVLLVDDDEVFIRRVQSLLAFEGMRVVSFSDTDRLLEIIDDLDPQLLLLDINMPGISGFDLCRKLRNITRWKNLPVVFISARSDWETRVAAYECGGDDFLAKPVINAELLIKTRIWLERWKRQERNESLDYLTGLLSYTGFRLSLEKMLKHEDQVSIAFFKVRNMAEINKQSGPCEADRLLVEIGKHLGSCFPLAALRGRWSGATFVLAAAAARQDLELAMQRFHDEFCQDLEAPAGLEICFETKILSPGEII